jgi:exosortase/archaeosortase family protein
VTYKRTSVVIAAALCAVSFVWLFHDVIAHLASDWSSDPNYSHGFLIPPVAAYLVWERRRQLMAMAPSSSVLGALCILGSVGVLLIGVLGAELFLTRIALLGTLAGIVVFLFGWGHLRVVSFPLLFMLLMIPLPTIVFNQIAFPLQLLASRVGEVGLSAAGIRSLITLLALGIMYGYFTDSRSSVRVLIAASTIPVAIIANSARVAGTGIAAHYYGAAAAQGFFHTFSGWLVFVVAFILLSLVARLVLFAAPRRRVVEGRASRLAAAVQ